MSRKGHTGHMMTSNAYEVDDDSADDPEEVEGGSEEEWTPEAGVEGPNKKRPQRAAAKKRQHSEEEEEEDEEEDEDEDDDENEESDSDTGKKPKRKRQLKKDDDEKEDDDEDDSDDNSYSESFGETPKDYTSGAFVVAKSDVGGSTDPTLWRIDGKALLQKFLPFEEDGKVLYKSTSTYSGWSVNNKDKYLAAQVTFKVQSKTETIVELHLDQQQQDVVKENKED